MTSFYRIFVFIICFSIFSIQQSLSEEVKKINIFGNERISDETVKMFASVSIGDDIDNNKINLILKELFGSGFFSDVNLKFENNILNISLIENPIIENIFFEGIKAKKIKDPITKNLKLKNRSSFNSVELDNDKKKIISILKELGYYFSEVDVFIKELDNNKVNIQYNIDLGKKAKIKKISFIGEKIFKDRKLRGIILSEEYKFWKFISGKKYLNEGMIDFDIRLLSNFYLNKGYYQAKIYSSFAKLINENEFELIYNIDAGPKFNFGDLSLNLPVDYDKSNFNQLEKLLKKLKNEPYSINSIEKILEEIDLLALEEQYESVDVQVIEKINDNVLNLTFEIIETEKFFVERINIFGNNVTEEEVIRNQLIIDEGDPFNEILKTKSINNIKSLNFFRDVESEVINSKEENSKIINITVKEKPTGEITAGAGVGTEGSTIMAGVKENNFLGKGISINTQLKLSEEDIKGNFTISNPNFNNSDKSVFLNIQALETDRMSSSGYKTNKTGFSVGTNFEYYDDLFFGLGNSNYYEKISTDATASARQQAQKGNYWDSFLNLNFTQDKRNQKFQTTKGYLSRYNLDIPIISDTNSFINTFNYKYFSELYNDNVSTFGISLGSAFSLDDSDIKLSERLFIPSSRLRGFENGKVGPKDGNDFVGGNYLATMNFTSSIPQLLPNSQDTDFSVFLDVANIWGVDYDSNLHDSGKIRSSIGIGLDWFTVIGPISFSYALPLSKDTNDVTQEFSFNLGTTF